MKSFDSRKGTSPAIVPGLLLAVVSLLCIINILIESPSNDGADITPAAVVSSSVRLPVASATEPPELLEWIGWQKATAIHKMTLRDQDTVLAPGQRCIVTERRGDLAEVRFGASCGWVEYSGLNPDAAPLITNLPPTGEVAPVDDETRAVLDGIAQKRGAMGVSAAVINNGVVSCTYEYGWANYAQKLPVSQNTKIRIASLSKVFTAMNAMAARELGVLSLDGDIGQILGYDVRNPKHPDDPITLRYLLTHTSSVWDIELSNSVRDGLTRGRSYLSDKPGSVEAWEYSNFAAGVVGSITEKAIGQTLYDFSESYFLRPMGIDASYHASRITAREDISLLYSGREVLRTVEEQLNRLFSDTPGENYVAYLGALTISSKDMASLLTILINDGQYGGRYYLSPESVDEMQQIYCTPDVFDQCLILRHRSDMYDGRELYYHTGNAQGVRSFLSYDEASGDGVVIIANGIGSSARDDMGIYRICGEMADYIYTQVL